MSRVFKWCQVKTRLATWNKPVFCIGECGSNYWYLNGKYHRENGPAAEYANGCKLWYLSGQPHTEDGHVISHAVIMQY